MFPVGYKLQGELSAICAVSLAIGILCMPPIIHACTKKQVTFQLCKQ